MYGRLQKAIGIADLVLVVLIISIFLGLGDLSDPMPLVTFIIFFSVLVNIIIFWRHRIPIVLLAIGVLFTLKVLTVDAFIDYAHIDVIAFLLGMMIVVAFLEDWGLFDAILSIIMSRCGGSARKFFVYVMLLAAVLAALVGEVSSILVMCSIVLKATKKYGVNPVPFIISVVFATNVGSVFTLIGNPVGVLIAFEANLSFEDFLIWALPTGIVVLGATLLITMKLFASDITKMDGAMKLETIKRSSVYSELLAHPSMRIPMVIFVGTMVGLVIHRPIEDIFSLQRNTMLLAVPLIAAAFSLIYGHKDTIDVVEKRVQWSTLVFFIFFFGVTGALEYSGVTDIMASKITSLTGGNMILTIVVFLWFTGILSAFMDNVLAVATITPILAVMGSAFPLWWAVLFGACFMGNLTIIGSSANIVATSYYEKNTGKSIGFYEWLKPGIIVALSQMAIATLMTVALHVYLFP